MKIFKRILPLAVAVIMLFSLALLVSAEEYVEWTLSEDKSTLTGDGKTYTRYAEPFAFWYKPTESFRYANNATNSSYSAPVCAKYKGADIVQLGIHSDVELYYATEEAKASLDRFFSGEGTYYLESSDSRFSKLDVSVNDSIFESDSMAETRTEEVYSLSDNKEKTYEIVVFDESNRYCYALGRVFWLDGRYWFVDYSTLNNNYFTADGKFSFRSGEVTLRALDDSITADIDYAAKNLSYRSANTKWEDYDPYYEKDTSDMPEYFFWIVFSLINFAAPAFIGGIAAIVANLKCLKKPKYFYFATLTSLVWIICAVVIAVLVA